MGFESSKKTTEQASVNKDVTVIQMPNRKEEVG